MAAGALLLGGCGGGQSTSQTGTSAERPAARTNAFAWLRPSSTPRGWPAVRIPAGASMAYPSGWTPIHGDPGTATVALIGPSHRYVGYLNLTPRQGTETITNWARFRPDHNRDEGDTRVATIAVVTGRHLGNVSESCVEDSYTTATNEKYIEIACIIRGPRSTVVAVGASPPQKFSRIGPLLRRAITSVMT